MSYAILLCCLTGAGVFAVRRVPCLHRLAWRLYLGWRIGMRRRRRAHSSSPPPSARVTIYDSDDESVPM